MLANISSRAAQRIEVFAKNLGLAFQITDDILDVTGTPEQLGKDVGKDERAPDVRQARRRRRRAEAERRAGRDVARRDRQPRPRREAAARSRRRSCGTEPLNLLTLAKGLKVRSERLLSA